MAESGTIRVFGQGMKMHFLKFLGASAMLCGPVAVAAESPSAIAADPLTYADLADLALPSNIVAHVQVSDAIRLKGAAAAGVPAGQTRFYVEADVITLIKGAQGLPSRISYLVDLPNDAAGRPAKLKKKSQFILLAAAVPGRPGELRLVAPDAQLAYSPERTERLREILREAVRPDAAPRITGIGRAFHVPGTLPGESETQIFLQTADGRPVSLTVLRRPGETPQWAVALSEIVDNAAEPPGRDTLLWYRLACTLPTALPPESLADAEPGQERAIAADYGVIRQGLGSCHRSRPALR